MKNKNITTSQCYSSAQNIPSMLPDNLYGIYFDNEDYHPKKGELVATVKNVYADCIARKFMDLNINQRNTLVRLFFFIVLMNSQFTTDLTYEQIAGAMEFKDNKTAGRYINLLVEQHFIYSSFIVSPDGKKIKSYSAISMIDTPNLLGTRTLRYHIDRTLEEYLFWNFYHSYHQTNVYGIPPLFDQPYIRKRYLKDKMEKKQNSTPDVVAVEAGKNGKETIEHTAPVAEPDNFIDRMFGFYGELKTHGKCLSYLPPFIQSDGRIHHRFHELSRKERETYVVWDDEQIEEIWDAHNMFFTLMFCDMSTKKIALPKYKELVLSGNMYTDVAAFISQKCGVQIPREKAKELLQQYKNTLPQKLVRRDGGYSGSINWIIRNNAQYGWTEKVAINKWADNSMTDGEMKGASQYMLRFADEYFKCNYPKVRDYIMGYSTREEKGGTYTKYYKKTGKTVVCHKKGKVISNLQRDLTKYETEIVSNRICQQLYEQYGIKSVSVHDAIYVKKSDAEKIRNNGISIDDLFRKEVEAYEYHEPEVLPLWSDEELG